MSTFRLLGGSIASAIYTATINSEFAEKLPGQVAKAVKPLGFDMTDIQSLIEAAATNTAKAYAKVPGITPEVVEASTMAVKQSYVDAFKVCFLVAVAFGIFGSMCALLSRSTPLEKKNAEKAVLLEAEKAAIDVRDDSV